jgi:hypothetical protein
MVKSPSFLFLIALYWLLSTSVLKNETQTKFFDSSRLQLSEGVCVHFRLSAMIYVSFVKKRFFHLSVFERVGSAFLQFYASSTLQRNGINHKGYSSSRENH